MSMTPSVGRIVHYVSYGTPGGEYGKECRAAVITEVSSRECDTAPVGLCVLNPAGLFFDQHVHYDAGEARASSPADAGKPLPPALCDGLEYKGGSWHWPARA